MKHPVKAPSVGESITEVSILKWARADGQAVREGDLLLEIETDKATVEVVAEATGALKILKPAGERVRVGEVVAEIDDAVKGKEASGNGKPTQKHEATTQAAGGKQAGPAARKMAAEKNIDLTIMSGTGKDRRVTKADLADGTLARARPESKPPEPKTADRAGDRRVPMSLLRQRIAERLVQAQHAAAILTTFNEADMSAVIALRNEHKEAFKAKHGVSLGFMSFFTRAAVEALRLFPDVNASLDGSDIVYHDYYDIGIAVGTDRGLVVPVVRGAGDMGFVEIEKRVAELAIKARDGKLSIPDLSGGTFTITNGGVYGSLLSTPILNPPQSGILGMHKIQERPVVIEGKMQVRPMMYLALSYDHRLIDGKGAVSFLVAVKDFIEHPEKLGLKY